MAADRRRRVAIATGGAWIGLVIGSLVVLDRLGRSRTFFYDEWNWVLGRRQGVRVFLEPHNGHLSLVPVAVFRILFATVGLRHYHVYQLVGLSCHVAVATVVMAIAWNRRSATLGLAAGTAVLLLGSGYQNIFWPFQIGFMTSCWAGLAALALVRRSRPRTDIAASVLLAIALASSGLGIAFLAGVTISLVAMGTGRRLWVVAAPLACYLAWYVGFGTSQAKASNLHLVPGYTLDSAAGAVAGVAGRPLLLGAFGAGLLGMAVLVRLWSRRADNPWLLGLVTTIGAFWSLTALARGALGEPTASRYVYVGAIIIILLAVEMMPTHPRPVHAAVGIAVAITSVWGNWHILHAGAGGLRYEGIRLSTELAALELQLDAAPAAYHLDPVHAPDLDAGRYRDTITVLGSPAYPAASIPRQPTWARTEADRVLWELVGATSVEPVGAGTSCHSTPATEWAVPPSGLIVPVARPVTVTVRRFGDGPIAASKHTYPAGAVLEVKFPVDASAVTWTVDFDVPEAACPA